MRLDEVETPALVIDLDALDHNIGVIADYYGTSDQVHPWT